MVSTMGAFFEKALLPRFLSVDRNLGKSASLIQTEYEISSTKLMSYMALA